MNDSVGLCAVGCVAGYELEMLLDLSDVNVRVSYYIDVIALSASKLYLSDVAIP